MYELLKAYVDEKGCKVNYVMWPIRVAVSGKMMTPAGATFPYGKDPKDNVIRIAPTYPNLEELRKAAEVFVICVRLSSINMLLSK